jgi:hypothetical protein
VFPDPDVAKEVPLPEDEAVAAEAELAAMGVDTLFG